MPKIWAVQYLTTLCAEFQRRPDGQMVRCLGGERRAMGLGLSDMPIRGGDDPVEPRNWPPAGETWPRGKREPIAIEFEHGSVGLPPMVEVAKQNGGTFFALVHMSQHSLDLVSSAQTRQVEMH